MRYWQVGEYISRKLESAEWGDGVIDQLARFLARTQSGSRGFTRRNLFRMRQFYECYRKSTIVSPLVSQLPWTHHLLILGYSKREEEREFYIRMASRSLSPPMIAEYETQLPDRKLLQAKLHEFYQLLAPPEENTTPATRRGPLRKARNRK